MKFIRAIVVAVAGGLIPLGAQAATVDVQGIKLEDTIEMQGSRLQLNGAGTRFKAIFKVYVAGLYLGKKVTTPEEVLSQPGPKRLAVTMLRTIDSKELGKLLYSQYLYPLEVAAVILLVAIIAAIANFLKIILIGMNDEQAAFEERIGM